MMQLCSNQKIRRHASQAKEGRAEGNESATQTETYRKSEAAAGGKESSREEEEGTRSEETGSRITN